MAEIDRKGSIQADPTEKKTLISKDNDPQGYGSSKKVCRKNHSNIEIIVSLYILTETHAVADCQWHECMQYTQACAPCMHMSASTSQLQDFTPDE